MHVHAVGAPHLADPTKLLASARRIYGDAMDSLWGETAPAPAGQVHALVDGDVIDAAGLHVTAVDTPGHAWHHMAYLLDGLCWTGDVAAVRFPGLPHVRVPTPPPEIDLPAWRRSLARLRELRADRLLPTHFGPVAVDTLSHLQAVDERLDAVAGFVRERWQAGQDNDAIIAAYQSWVAQLAQADGADADAVHRYEVIVPSEMCVQGLVRYWQKQAGKGEAVTQWKENNEWGQWRGHGAGATSRSDRRSASRRQAAAKGYSCRSSGRRTLCPWW